MGHIKASTVRFGRHIATRFSAPIVDRLSRLAARREERITEFIRAAVRERLERLEREEVAK